MDDLRTNSLAEIERAVCDIASVQLCVSREDVHLHSRFVEDLHVDSLDVIELFMELEERFEVHIPPHDEENSICKHIFTRPDFRLRDLAEIVYLQLGTGYTRNQRGRKVYAPAIIETPFCQLGSRWERDPQAPLFEVLNDDGPHPIFRRRSDGMRCIFLPAATVEIGTDSPEYNSDARPAHPVPLDSFLIDMETVSTTAYCRFLNSIGSVDWKDLLEWFVLDEQDDRDEHMLIEKTETGWQPLEGCERLPMILVSWYGANAYSLWANGKEWQGYPSEWSFLPTEAQWEYAARGASFSEFPGGIDSISQEVRAAQHVSGETYTPATLPMDTVHSTGGMSPFGLHHMAGNVWQWCRDWYADDFYSRPEASERNGWNRVKSGVRSERGGSWVGPEELCRSSYRRGRAPRARGRCLGFRCVSDPIEIASLD